MVTSSYTNSKETHVPYGDVLFYENDKLQKLQALESHWGLAKLTTTEQNCHSAYVMRLIEQIINCLE